MMWKINNFLKDKKQCPICGTFQKNFIPHGNDTYVSKKYKIIGSGLRNVKCIKCGSNDRERLIYLYIRDYIKIHGKVLHIAPESLLDKLFKGINHIKGDFFVEGYEYDKTIKLDLKYLPFPDKSFDYIICNHVLEHIEDDISAMKELYRVCKGMAILQVPISNITNTIENLDEYDRHDHVRIYGKDYIKRLNKVGFNVDRINISNVNKYKTYGLNPHEDIFIGRRNDKLYIN